MYGNLTFCYCFQAIEKSPNREACPLDCSSASDKNLLEDDFSGMEDFGFEVMYYADLLMELMLHTYNQKLYSLLWNSLVLYDT